MRNTYFSRLTCLGAAVKFILPTVCSKKGFFLSSWLFTDLDGGSRGGISFGLRLQFKQNFVFSGLYSEIWPAKLNDHSARSYLEI